MVISDTLHIFCIVSQIAHENKTTDIFTAQVKAKLSSYSPFFTQWCASIGLGRAEAVSQVLSFTMFKMDYIIGRMSSKMALCTYDVSRVVAMVGLCATEGGAFSIPMDITTGGTECTLCIYIYVDEFCNDAGV